jgi:hypothetical protein
MLTFETTHEYHLGNDPNILYCEDHESLIVTEDYQDRLLISGISKSTMLKFASKFYKESLKNELTEKNGKEVNKEVDTFHMDQAFDKAKAE